ncbi:MAG: AsmA family protein [Burkholderiales bacterium]|nr:AsmA family protein [Burkholderiales bacterium]
MKKILIIASLLILVLFGTLLSVPYWFDINQYKDNILNLVKEKSGRDVKVAGKITLTVLPNISLTLNDASFASPIKGEPDIFTTSKLIIKVKFIPLFSKRLEVDSFKLVDSVFNLHIMENGKPNWVEQKLVHIDVAHNDVHAEGQEGMEPHEPTFSNLIFNSIKIENASVNFVDDRNHQTIKISSINLNTSLKPGPNPFEVSAKFDIFDDNTKGLLAADGTYYVGDDQFEARNVSLLFDGIEAHLNFLADIGPYKPSYKIAIYTGSINFNNYKITDNKTNASNKGQSAGADEEANKKTFEWSDEPLDLSFIHKTDLHLNLKTSGITYQDIATNEIMFNAYIRNNRLTANVKDSKLYGGLINGEVIVDSSAGGNNAIKAALKIDHLDFTQVPKKFERINPIAGNATYEFKVSSNGNTQRSIVRNMNGTASVKMNDVALEGIDIFSMVNNVVSAFEVGRANNKTMLKLVSGDFDIKQGVMSNDNTVLNSDVMNLTGSGEINLNDLGLNYKLSPRYANETEDKKNMTIPLVITGTMLEPVFRLEIKALVQDLINNPKGAENLVNQLKMDFKGMKENMGGGVINDLKGMFKKK